LKFTTALGDKLNSIRQEDPEKEFEEEVTQDNWMKIGENSQTEFEPDCQFNDLIDPNTNWDNIRGKYTNFDKVIILESLMRQTNPDNDPDQAHFMELLPRLRNGESTREDWELLIKRFPTQTNQKEFEVATRIFNDNESVNYYNIDQLKKCNQPVCLIRATNSGSRGKTANEQQFSGLVNAIYLCVDAKVALNNNLWAEKG